MPVDFRVYLVTDRGQARGGDILAAVAAALDGGIRAVQLREKDLGGRELFRLAEAMREAVSAGRKAYRAGRIGRKLYATASSPLDGTFF